MSTLIRRTAVAATFAAGLLLSATPAAAQNTGPGWRAWVGCWTPAAPGQTIVDFKAAPVICVSPTANANVVELVTLGETKVLARDTIDATGVERSINTKNCSGAQSARFSNDERRVYLRSSSSCDGLKSSTSAILAMSAEGEWLDVRGVNAGEGSNVRVARYRAVQIPTQTLDSLLGGNAFQSSSAARIAAGAPVGTAAITEAVKSVDNKVVESWILERGQRFNMDVSTLVSLSDAGVPGNVTDAMIAVSNPGAFHLARADGEGVIRTRDDDVRGNRIHAGTMSYCDPYSRFYDSYDCRYAYDRYGYNRYGYGSGYGYGYGYGYNGGYYGPAVVVITGNAATASPSGQAVNGRGYRQTGGSSQSGTAATRDRSSAPSTSTSSGSNSGASTSSSSGSSSGSSSSSSSSGDRTAKGRP